MYDDANKEYKISYKVLVEIKGEVFLHSNLNREDIIKEAITEMKKGGFINFSEYEAKVKDITECRIIKEYKREKVKT